LEPFLLLPTKAEIAARASRGALISRHNMKTFHPSEVEHLRAEVRALRSQVAHLEERLSESEEGDDEEMRALWPYNWVLTGVETVKNALETKRAAKRTPRRFEQLDPETRFSRMMM